MRNPCSCCAASVLAWAPDTQASACSNQALQSQVMPLSSFLYGALCLCKHRLDATSSQCVCGSLEGLQPNFAEVHPKTTHSPGLT
jgi:hypothetical protein